MRPSKFTADTITVLLNSIRRGNFRKTACKEADISDSILNKWLRNPGEEYQEFRKMLEQAEASVESMAVHKILEAGEKDAKWYAWWLERKFPKRWNTAVYRWEFQNMQRQMKQLRSMIDELVSDDSPSRITQTKGLEDKGNTLEILPSPN